MVQDHVHMIISMPPIETQYRKGDVRIISIVPGPSQHYIKEFKMRTFKLGLIGLDEALEQKSKKAFFFGEVEAEKKDIKILCYFRIKKQQSICIN